MAPSSLTFSNTRAAEDSTASSNVRQGHCRGSWVRALMSSSMVTSWSNRQITNPVAFIRGSAKFPLDGIAASPAGLDSRPLGCRAEQDRHRAWRQAANRRKKIADLRSALPHIKAPSRDDWLTVMFAIHNDIGGQFGLTYATSGRQAMAASTTLSIRCGSGVAARGSDLRSHPGDSVQDGHGCRLANIPEPAETPENIRAYVISLVEKGKA